MKGQFRDAPQADAYYKTPQQRLQLDGWYKEGRADKAKRVTAELAVERMEKRRCVTSGRRFFSWRTDFCSSCAAVDRAAPPLGLDPTQLCARLGDGIINKITMRSEKIGAFHSTSQTMVPICLNAS